MAKCLKPKPRNEVITRSWPETLLTIGWANWMLKYLTFGDPERSKVMIVVKLLHYCYSNDLPRLPITTYLVIPLFLQSEHDHLHNSIGKLSLNSLDKASSTIKALLHFHGFDPGLLRFGTVVTPAKFGPSSTLSMVLLRCSYGTRGRSTEDLRVRSGYAKKLPRMC